MLINALLRIMQQFCRHDYECLGRYVYMISEKQETVWFCNRCATCVNTDKPLITSAANTSSFIYTS